jgi:uncharacterized membrane protein YqaE (UPF0057 family)
MNKPSLFRLLLAAVFPPLAVLHKGCGTVILVFALWMAGLFPGILAAVIITWLDMQPEKPKRDFTKKPKRKGAYIRLSDGEVAEIIEDDSALPARRKHF